MGKVVFSGVVLDKESRNHLKDIFKEYVKNGLTTGELDKWVIHCHHMTICFGELKDKSLLGQSVGLRVKALGRNETAIAVQVDGFDFKIDNKIPHITLAVDASNGGKPQNSNDILTWFPFSTKILTGVVREVSYGK